MQQRKRPVEILTPEEARAIRDAAPGLREQALVQLMWRTGLRISEALDLRPLDVNLSEGYLRVLHPKGFASGRSHR